MSAFRDKVPTHSELAYNESGFNKCWVPRNRFTRSHHRLV